MLCQKLHFNVTFSPKPTYLRWTPTQRFSNQNCGVRNSFLPWVDMLQWDSPLFSVTLSSRVFYVWSSLSPWSSWRRCYLVCVIFWTRLSSRLRNIMSKTILLVSAPSCDCLFVCVLFLERMPIGMNDVIEQDRPFLCVTFWLIMSHGVQDF